jgi:large subunit ribosomal protein L24
MKLKKGDKVKVITGKDKGRDGTIERVYTKSERVLILGMNMYKKHVKKNDQMPQGGVVDLPRPLDVSKVMFMCEKCGKPTRLGYQINEGKKIRVCRKCQTQV